MMTGPSASAEATCTHCGSLLRPYAPYCGSCGQAITARVQTAPVSQPPPVPNPGVRAHTVGAGSGVRCCSFLMDLAAMLSPALPLAIAGATLGVAQVVYVVVPVAFVAVWIWMQMWQSFTGMTFGKAMLGLRLVRTDDHRVPGLPAVVLRSLVFAMSAGLAAAPLLSAGRPPEGLHDRLSGLTVIDVSRGDNPLGARPQVTLRRTPTRGLNKVQSPVSLGNVGRR